MKWRVVFRVTILNNDISLWTVKWGTYREQIYNFIKSIKPFKNSLSKVWGEGNMETNLALILGYLLDSRYKIHNIFIFIVHGDIKKSTLDNTYWQILQFELTWGVQNGFWFLVFQLADCFKVLRTTVSGAFTMQQTVSIKAQCHCLARHDPSDTPVSLLCYIMWFVVKKTWT